MSAEAGRHDRFCHERIGPRGDLDLTEARICLLHLSEHVIGNRQHTQIARGADIHDHAGGNPGCLKESVNLTVLHHVHLVRHGSKIDLIKVIIGQPDGRKRQTRHLFRRIAPRRHRHTSPGEIVKAVKFGVDHHGLHYLGIKISNVADVFDRTLERFPAA